MRSLEEEFSELWAESTIKGRKLKPTHSAALEWAKAVLKGHLTLLKPLCSAALEVWQLALLSWLREQRIGIRSVHLDGNVKTSLHRLRAHYGRRTLELFVPLRNPLLEPSRSAEHGG